MIKYLVKCFNNGRPEGVTHRDVEADSFIEAAQLIRHEPLHGKGPTSHMRVRVWVQETPGLSMTFYADKQRPPPGQ